MFRVQIVVVVSSAKRLDKIGTRAYTAERPKLGDFIMPEDPANKNDTVPKFFFHFITIFRAPTKYRICCSPTS